MYPFIQDTFRGQQVGEYVTLGGHEDWVVDNKVHYAGHLKGNFTDEQIDDGEDLIDITAYVFYTCLDDEDADGNFVDTHIWYIRVYVGDYYFYDQPDIDGSLYGYEPETIGDKIEDFIGELITKHCTDIDDFYFVSEEKQESQLCKTN